MVAPVVIPESVIDGADTTASTISAADRASVRILSWLSQYRRYPASARRARLEGTVEIVVVLLPDEVADLAVDVRLPQVRVDPRAQVRDGARVGGRGHRG